MTQYAIKLLGSNTQNGNFVGYKGLSTNTFI